MTNNQEWDPTLVEELREGNKLLAFSSLSGKWKGVKKIYDLENDSYKQQELTSEYIFSYPITKHIFPKPKNAIVIPEVEEYFKDDEFSHQSYLSDKTSEFKKIDSQYSNNQTVTETMFGYWNMAMRRLLVKNEEKTKNGYYGDIRHDGYCRTLIKFLQNNDDRKIYSYEFIVLTENHAGELTLNSTEFEYENETLIRKIIVDQKQILD